MAEKKEDRLAGPFAVRPGDRDFYRQRLAGFLPAEIIDVHTHVWPAGLRAGDGQANRRTVSWPSRVAAANPVEDLRETYRLLLPGCRVTPLLFATVPPPGRLEESNAYVRAAAAAHRLPALLFTSPAWSGPELEERLIAGSFHGAKPYLSLAPDYLPPAEIRVFDFIPPAQLEVLDRRGALLMLHLPRPLRLRDPVNLAQLLEIERAFPRLRVVVAHVGRAYCPTDVGPAFAALAGTQRLLFDISANTSAWVFARLLEAVGPRRVLFGSDLPITRMRMRRVCEDGVYVNVVPAGLYGDVSADRNMRAVSGPAAEKLTFFLYEQLDAFRRAAGEAGLGDGDLRRVFHDNARDLLAGADRPQLQMVLSPRRLAGFRRPPCPAGYRLRTWRAGDGPAYMALMRRAGFGGWNAVERVLAGALPGGIFFAVDRRSGCLVATATAQHRPRPGQPFGGELGWVAVDPAHRGCRLGRVVSAAAVQRLAAAGYRRVYLCTDDWRLPAIGLYRDLGFRPWSTGPESAGRWRRVIARSG